jgi:phenylalanyl-tRNA synthetase alpha chain
LHDSKKNATFAAVFLIDIIMALINERIAEIQQQLDVLTANSFEEVDALRIKYLSKKGEITELFNLFRMVPKEEKAAMGQALNALRQLAETKIGELKEKFEAEKLQQDKLDLTRTPDPIALGTRHPLSLVREQIVDIFARIGFTVADGPEVEDDKHVFGMLNFAPEHPARDMQDTFFIEKEKREQKPTDVLLRTHTSSVQTRVMTSQKPPIRVLTPFLSTFTCSPTVTSISPSVTVIISKHPWMWRGKEKQDPFSI